MTDLDRIKGRCTVDEITGCWIWKGATSISNDGQTRIPRVYTTDWTADESGKTKSVQTGNRGAWHASTGKAIPDGHRVFKNDKCSDLRCVNPEHMSCGNCKTWGSSMASKGTHKNSLNHIMANRAIGLKRSHATPEIAAQILSSNETGLELAARLKLGRTVVSRVRRGKLTSVLAANNPFIGLLA